MKRQIILIILLCCPVLLPVPGYAAGRDGNGLLEACETALLKDKGKDNAVEALSAGFCLGFIGGVTDMHTTMHTGDYSKKIWCSPWQDINQPNINQPIRVVLKYLQEHPEKLHHPAVFLVILALKEAFPTVEGECPK